MTRSQIQNLAALIFTGIIAVNANAAPVSADQLSAQKAVAKVIKNPEEAKFGEFTIAGPHVRDPRSLQPFLDKPAAAIAMAFSADPHGGLSAERFSGDAVVFVGTVGFAANTADPTRTASLY